MDEELFSDIHNRLNDSRSNDESPQDVLYDALEKEFEEIIVIGKRGNETYVSFDYQDALTALGMLKIAEFEILQDFED